MTFKPLAQRILHLFGSGDGAIVKHTGGFAASLITRIARGAFNHKLLLIVLALEYFYLAFDPLDFSLDWEEETRVLVVRSRHRRYNGLETTAWVHQR